VLTVVLRSAAAVFALLVCALLVAPLIIR